MVYPAHVGSCILGIDNDQFSLSEPFPLFVGYPFEITLPTQCEEQNSSRSDHSVQLLNPRALKFFR